MPRRPYGSEEDYNLLRLAMLEQASMTPGRTPSGLATNAYLASIPRTFEQEREAKALLDSDERYARTREADRARQDELADLRAGATARQFQTRRNVRDLSDEDVSPIAPSRAKSTAFTAEHFRPVTSREALPVRNIQRINQPEEAVSVTAPRKIRRFTDVGGGFTDPDAAMSAAQKANIDPRVLAAQAAGDARLMAVLMRAGRGIGDGGPNARQQQNERIVSGVKDLRQRVGPLTVGPGGAILSKLPGTDATDFEADLDFLRANISFGQLQAMRDASKTGGALGQVAIRELELLESSLGALSARQSPSNFLKNLDRIEGSINRFEAEQQRQGMNATSAQEEGGQIFDFVPGRGLVPATRR